MEGAQGTTKGESTQKENVDQKKRAADQNRKKFGTVR